MRLIAVLAIAVVAWVSAAGACVVSGYQPGLVAAWADGIAASQRGPLDVANPELGLPTQGVPADALGAATGVSVFSLGDGGFLTAQLSTGIWDGPGDDLVVFENSFWNLEGLFAEFAQVEVSSNGTDFARFPNATYQTAPVPSFGSIDPCLYDGFAGDKVALEGTGFDLAELAGDPLVGAGLLDLADVRYVRVVDVIGDGSTLDSGGLPIYDPYPTIYDTGGFDVDAIGALHAPEPSAALSLLTGSGLLCALAGRRRGTCRACRNGV